MPKLPERSLKNGRIGNKQFIVNTLIRIKPQKQQIPVGKLSDAPSRGFGVIFNEFGTVHSVPTEPRRSSKSQTTKDCIGNKKVRRRRERVEYGPGFCNTMPEKNAHGTARKNK